jgi:hypothetical protein
LSETKLLAEPLQTVVWRTISSPIRGLTKLTLINETLFRQAFARRIRRTFPNQFVARSACTPNCVLIGSWGLLFNSEGEETMACLTKMACVEKTTQSAMIDG